MIGYNLFISGLEKAANNAERTTTGDRTNKRKQVKGVNFNALCAEG